MSSEPNPLTSEARPNFIGATWTKHEMQNAWDSGYRQGWHEHAAQPAPADVAQLRALALATAVQTIPAGYSTGGTVREAAEEYLDFLTHGSSKDPEPVVRVTFPGDAPDPLHDALDRVWASIAADPDDADRLAAAADADADALEPIRLLTDDDLARTTFAFAILRSVTKRVRAAREEGTE
jgi:hypothetical protein